MSSNFDIKVRGPPNEDIVQGYPGIGATWPRLEGTVEIRSKDASQLQITLVSIALYRTDIIHTPSNKPGITAPKKDQNFLVGESMKLFQVPIGKTYEDSLAMDLPFIYSLPTNRPMPASICLGKGSVETTYQLFVSLVYGKQQQNHHISYPIRIKRYDTLSTFGAYKVPIVDSISSADHLVGCDYSIPISSYGPGDNVTAFIKIFPNPDWLARSRKVKLQRITMQVVEETVFNHEGDEPVERRRRLCKAVNQLDIKLPEKGYQCEMSIDFPALDLRDKDGLVYKERQDVPLSSRNGFTTSAALYRLNYYLLLKARFNHCKDIEIEQPITVTSFDHPTCMSFMKSISEAVHYANHVDKNRYPAPRVYKSSDILSWGVFGAKPVVNGGSSKMAKGGVLVR